jgi:hypothetical protein
LVLNYIHSREIREDYAKIITLDNDNLEPILKFGKYENKDCYFITHLFVEKLKNVWEKKSQFTKYDVKKMFCDFWNALNFLKSQNICHGSICPNNLAFNGKNWYVSGLLSIQKTGKCMSGYFVPSTFKSRRSNIANYEILKFISVNNYDKLNVVPSDDMWQLVLMYVITYYGINLIDVKNFIENIYKGECQEISKSVYGKYLKEILINDNEMKNDDYGKILNIFKNNTDDHF